LRFDARYVACLSAVLKEIVMPAKQPAQAKNPATPTTTVRKAPPAAARPSARSGERENYDLISVLYHALQGAETVSQYLEDARNADDEELMTFFEETRTAYAERAAEAKQLLADRLEGSEDEDEDESEDDEEEEDDDDEEEE
jgi:hypothetical protein